MEILVGDVNARLGREDISNQQLEITVYIRIVIIIVLD
jgi:hypothetical protein